MRELISFSFKSTEKQFLAVTNSVQHGLTIKLNLRQETLRVVTIAMICFTLLHFENFNISGGLYVTQLNIYDGAFIVKIVSR